MSFGVLHVYIHIPQHSYVYKALASCLGDLPTWVLRSLSPLSINDCEPVRNTPPSMSHQVDPGLPYAPLQYSRF